MNRSLCLIGFWVVSLACLAPATAQSLLIENVTLVSPELPQPQGKRNVLIRDGRIAQISVSPIAVASEVRRLDGSGKFLTIAEIAGELSRRLTRLFLKDETGERPVLKYHPKLAGDPHFKDLVLFHEYFHGDTGRGVGASHQTGWTGLVAKLLQPRDESASVPPVGAALRRDSFVSPKPSRHKAAPTKSEKSSVTAK